MADFCRVFFSETCILGVDCDASYADYARPAVAWYLADSDAPQFKSLSGLLQVWSDLMDHDVLSWRAGSGWTSVELDALATKSLMLL